MLSLMLNAAAAPATEDICAARLRRRPYLAGPCGKTSEQRNTRIQRKLPAEQATPQQEPTCNATLPLMTAVKTAVLTVKTDVLTAVQTIVFTAILTAILTAVLTAPDHHGIKMC